MLAVADRDLLAQMLDARVHSLRSCTNSDFSQHYRVRLDDDRDVFLKVNTNCAADFFSAEALGLLELNRSGGVRVAQCLAHTERWIAIEWLPPARPDQSFNASLAHGLATQHACGSTMFGYPSDNYCGPSRQHNRQSDSGHVFFAEQRLMPQAKRAFESGLLDAAQLDSIERICLRLPALIPEQSPALLHGDLWRGNVLSVGTGEPALIDPACYFGWPEADLAMMQLFGGFDAAVFSIYDELRPRPSGFVERQPIYNLYHLLNHLNLFGNAYLHEVNRILQRYA